MYLMLKRLYVFIIFKYHEIYFENVLVKCYVYNKYVLLVFLICKYINSYCGLVITEGWIQSREALSKEVGF